MLDLQLLLQVFRPPPVPGAVRDRLIRIHRVVVDDDNDKPFLFSVLGQLALQSLLPKEISQHAPQKSTVTAEGRRISVHADKKPGLASGLFLSSDYALISSIFSAVNSWRCPAFRL